MGDIAPGAALTYIPLRVKKKKEDGRVGSHGGRGVVGDR